MIGLPNNVMQDMGWTDADYLIFECDVQNNTVLLRTDFTPKCAAPAVDDKASINVTADSSTILEALVDILSRPLPESSAQVKVRPTPKSAKNSAKDVVDNAANPGHADKTRPAKNTSSSDEENARTNGKVPYGKKNTDCKITSDKKYTNGNKNSDDGSDPPNPPTNTQAPLPYQNLVDSSVGRYVVDTDTDNYRVVVHGDEDEQGGDQ